MGDVLKVAERQRLGCAQVTGPATRYGERVVLHEPGNVGPREWRDTTLGLGQNVIYISRRVLIGPDE